MLTKAYGHMCSSSANLHPKVLAIPAFCYYSDHLRSLLELAKKHSTIQLTFLQKWSGSSKINYWYSTIEDGWISISPGLLTSSLCSHKRLRRNVRWGQSCWLCQLSSAVLMSLNRTNPWQMDSLGIPCRQRGLAFRGQTWNHSHYEGNPRSGLEHPTQ